MDVVCRHVSFNVPGQGFQETFEEWSTVQVKQQYIDSQKINESMSIILKEFDLLKNGKAVKEDQIEENIQKAKNT